MAAAPPGVFPPSLGGCLSLEQLPGPPPQPSPDGPVWKTRKIDIQRVCLGPLESSCTFGLSQEPRACDPAGPLLWTISVFGAPDRNCKFSWRPPRSRTPAGCVLIQECHSTPPVFYPTIIRFPPGKDAEDHVRVKDWPPGARRPPA